MKVNDIKGIVSCVLLFLKSTAKHDEYGRHTRTSTIVVSIIQASGVIATSQNHIAHVLDWIVGIPIRLPLLKIRLYGDTVPLNEVVAILLVIEVSEVYTIYYYTDLHNKVLLLNFDYVDLHDLQILTGFCNRYLDVPGCNFICSCTHTHTTNTHMHTKALT